jgi:hypothetical protein
VRQDICPGCGSENRCEVARTGSSGSQCWCMAVDMPADQVIPPRGTPCFCRDCMTANEKAPDETGAFPAIER